MGKKIERQVRYNFRRSEDDFESMEMLFLIIGDNRDIVNASRSIANLFGPIFNERTTYEGAYRGTGLRYKLMDFDTRKKPNFGWPSKIAKNVVRDSDLYRRKNPVGLEVYVAEHKWNN